MNCIRTMFAAFLRKQIIRYSPRMNRLTHLPLLWWYNVLIHSILIVRLYLISFCIIYGLRQIQRLENNFCGRETKNRVTSTIYGAYHIMEKRSTNSIQRTIHFLLYPNNRSNINQKKKNFEHTRRIPCRLFDYFKWNLLNNE